MFVKGIVTKECMAKPQYRPYPQHLDTVLRHRAHPLQISFCKSCSPIKERKAPLLTGANREPRLLLHSRLARISDKPYQLGEGIKEGVADGLTTHHTACPFHCGKNTASRRGKVVKESLF
jgi:hypothetical protein